MESLIALSMGLIHDLWMSDGILSTHDVSVAMGAWILRLHGCIAAIASRERSSSTAFGSIFASA